MNRPTMQTRPVMIIVAGLGGVVEAVIAAAVAFGLDWSGDQVAAVMGVVGVSTAMATALLAQARVYAPATVEALRKPAKRAAKKAGS